MGVLLPQAPQMTPPGFSRIEVLCFVDDFVFVNCSSRSLSSANTAWKSNILLTNKSLGILSSIQHNYPSSSGHSAEISSITRCWLQYRLRPLCFLLNTTIHAHLKTSRNWVGSVHILGPRGHPDMILLHSTWDIMCATMGYLPGSQIGDKHNSQKRSSNRDSTTWFYNQSTY